MVLLVEHTEGVVRTAPEYMSVEAVYQDSDSDTGTDYSVVAVHIEDTMD
jgi:hypothetical protein